MAIDGMLVAAGAGTGLLVGLTGVGGGSIMTPLLLLVFGVAPVAAIGTDLWFAALTKLVATRVHQGTGLIDWQVVRRLWAGSLPAAAATLAWMAWLPVGADTARMLKVLIAVSILVTATAMLLQAQLHALGRRLRLHDATHFKAMQAPLTVAAGALLGTLVTLTSIGAGALGVVFLAYLYPLRLTPSRLIAIGPSNCTCRAARPAGAVSTDISTPVTTPASTGGRYGSDRWERRRPGAGSGSRLRACAAGHRRTNRLNGERPCLLPLPRPARPSNPPRTLRR